ncbi:cyclic nucleotide-binding protein [Rouxiella sp. WC2420]|uniref:Cyclic nucleotide-binding protein n=1 Tax=Rouxiella sp. WC2420 TaxID=3234145 RepID=A0AB39VY43_9GAMM
MELHTAVGLIGVFCYLLAYALVQMRKLAVDADLYAYLNIIGGVFGLYSLSHDFNLASCISQSMWLIFTLIGMKSARKRRFNAKTKLPPVDLN